MPTHATVSPSGNISAASLPDAISVTIDTTDTLFQLGDADGNPVTVTYRNGIYGLATADDGVRQELVKVRGLLEQILQALKGR
jgi:hypothetical protein